MNPKKPDEICLASESELNQITQIETSHKRRYECLTIVLHFGNSVEFLIWEKIYGLTQHRNIMPTVFLEGRHIRHNKHIEFSAGKYL